MPAIGTFAIGLSAVGVSGSVPTSVGYEQAPLKAALGLDVPAGAILATIIAEGASVRYRDDGGEPSAAVGMPLAVGEPLHYVGDLSSLRFAGQGDGATLNVLYYGSTNPTGE